MTSLRPLRAPLLLGGALAASAALAGPAQAATYTHHDPTHDVSTVDDGGHVYARPHNAVTDVTRLTTRFSGQAVTVTATFRKLQQTDFGVDVEFKVPSKPLRYHLDYDLGDPDGPDLNFIYADQVVACKATGHVDRSARQVVVKVPRSCINGAKVVRTGLEATSQKKIGPGADDYDFFVDDAQQRGIASGMADVELGPQVHRS